ncbi:hypothetical protein HYZ41_00250, partial [archaeon]|nr:hypothetical protein [archaeon]
KHKKNRSLTYIEGSKIKNTWAFRTNISSFSPVFARFLEQEKIITARKNTNTSSYSKYLPRNLVKRMINKEALFQGIMDGDGSYNISNNHGIYITLSLDPSVRYDFIKSFPLVPTASLDINEKLIAFKQNSTEQLREIRFAPSSLKSISNKYSVEDIANQIEFMLRSAENSIRPDKVHKLIQITKRISSKEYGENRHHLEIQKEIRHETRKRNMNNMIKKLEKRFPMSNGFYKPFIPKWSENFASKNVWKQEFWDFFLSGEYLIKNNYPKPEIMDFSDGVPIDFNMTQIVRN